MSAQSEPIQIKNFQQGVASSPYLGFGKIVGLDIYKKPGIIQAGTATLNTSKLTDNYNYDNSNTK